MFFNKHTTPGSLYLQNLYEHLNHRLENPSDFHWGIYESKRCVYDHTFDEITPFANSLKRQNKKDRFYYVLEKAFSCASKAEFLVTKRFVQNRYMAINAKLSDIKINNRLWISHSEAMSFLKDNSSYVKDDKGNYSEQEVIYYLEHCQTLQSERYTGDGFHSDNERTTNDPDVIYFEYNYFDDNL